MFLPQTKLFAVAQKQFYFKLKTHIGLFSTMIALQTLALFLSLRGTGQMGVGSNYMKLSVNYISNDLIVVFTAGWALYMAILLTTKSYRNIDFAFVSNRVTSSMANIALLLTFGLIGGLTSALIGVLLRVIGYFYFGSTTIVGQGFFITPGEMLTGIIAAALYITLIGAVGYFVGMLAQLSQVLSFLIPALVVGIWIVDARSGGALLILKAIEFYTHEGSLAIFALKVLIAAFLIFVMAINFSNRLEVRK